MLLQLLRRQAVSTMETAPIAEQSHARKLKSMPGTAKGALSYMQWLR